MNLAGYCSDALNSPAAGWMRIEGIRRMQAGALRPLQESSAQDAGWVVTQSNPSEVVLLSLELA